MFLELRTVFCRMHLIHEYGLVAVAAIIGLECLGLPVPGEAALLGAAIYAGTKHDFNINAVIAAAAVAAIAGRTIGYIIGHKFGSLATITIRPLRGADHRPLQGRLVLPLVFIAVIALIAGALFVRQREAQLITEAERAIPGSLELR